VPVAVKAPKSSAVAEPNVAVHVAETAPALPSARVTVKTMSWVPLLPSTVVASAMLSVPGWGGTTPPKLWPALTPPGVSSAISAQWKSS
jgi:hypothetical protein